MRTSTLTLLLATVLLTSCSKNKLPDYNRLGGFRVLGIKVNTPETTVGSSVTVTPIISDIGGHGRPITYFAQGCTDPGVGYGAAPNCSGATDTVTLASGTITLTSPLFTAATGAVTFSLPSSLLDGKSTVAQLIGIPYLVVYTLNAPGGASQTAFKRIYVSTNPTKNTNPTLTDVTSAAGTFTVLPVKHETLTPVISSGSEEGYSSISVNGTVTGQTETLTTTWFASEGSFDHQRTEGFTTNGFDPGARAADHSVVLVVVTRDNRGGEDFLIRGL